MSTSINLNHLTIYDIGIPEKYKFRLKVLKTVYITFLILTAVSALLLSYSRLQGHNYPEFIYAGVSFLGLITSFAYVIYPKYEFSKMVFTRVIITLYVIISISVFIGTVFWIVGAAVIGRRRNWEDQALSQYLLDIGIILMIFASPFVVSLIIISTYLVRRRIARKLNQSCQESNEESLITSDDEHLNDTENNQTSGINPLTESSKICDKDELESHLSAENCTSANSVNTLDKANNP
ncbi:unnamed protein product [Moneuplotes crassus]|uniref:Uncharacterized protein n=1 Tax=Euplotes crassus TaxID=5936 RepID=A0AAD1XS18_EUPCR|nr:unnamed protein product [Moneuplotes crassus]